MIAEKVVNLTVVDDPLYGHHLTHDKEVPDLERHARLKNRLADEENRGGMTMRRLAIEIGKINAEAVTEKRIMAWANDPQWGRDLPRYWDDNTSLATKLENAIEARFARLDDERANAPFTRPPTVETSVTTRIIEAIHRARRKSCPMVIEAPSGCGKTAAIDEYIARSRKTEGFDCPIWRIELSPSTLKMKPVLAMMLLTAQGLDPAENWNFTDPEYVLALKLKSATGNRGGVFIIDEAQGLGDAKNDQAIQIFNELRGFTDKRLFGLVLIDNGEIYKRFRGEKLHQLASRIESQREVITGVTDNDVDLIMLAWNVSGEKERAYCQELAKQMGHFRLLCDTFEACLDKYGTINHQLLLKARAAT